jgi:hypothetical protein
MSVDLGPSPDTGYPQPGATLGRDHPQTRISAQQLLEAERA